MNQHSTSKDFDIVIYGATSFVGKITVAYFLTQYGLNQDQIKWAIAARSEDKLSALKTELNQEYNGAEYIPHIIADANHPSSLALLCQQSNVVISTVGPYALYGEALIKACAESGTHYCDLTGEPIWIADMMKKYSETAKTTGAKIVHCCGFDSIPSDLGVFFLQQHAKAKFGSNCNKVELGVKALKGFVSGGTVASIANAVKEAANDKVIRKKANDPYLLCPKKTATKQRNDLYYHSPSLASWCALFIMAPINTKVVHRSNALQNYAYGEDFLYSEYMMSGDGLKGKITAMLYSSGIGSLIAGLAIAPTRYALTRFILPKPSQGPSKASQENGFYDLRLVGQTPKGDTLAVKVTGDKDPGYGSTAKILAEAAVCLRQTEAAGGFWTPAAIMGEPLIKRLEDNAGLSFSTL